MTLFDLMSDILGIYCYSYVYISVYGVIKRAKNKGKRLLLLKNTKKKVFLCRA